MYKTDDDEITGAVQNLQTVSGYLKNVLTHVIMSLSSLSTSHRMDGHVKHTAHDCRVLSYIPFCPLIIKGPRRESFPRLFKYFISLNGKSSHARSKGKEKKENGINRCIETRMLDHPPGVGM